MTMNDSFEFDAALNEMENDLDLLAFCYLTDDLSSAAKAVFELRLATEQPAREALARAVELSAALQQASRVEFHHAASAPAHTSPSLAVPATAQPRAFDRWMRVTSFLAIGSAACLAVMIGIRAIPQAKELLSPETALVWIQVRDAWPESPVAEALGSAAPASETALSAGEREVDPLAEEQVEGELNSEMPGWLLTAVAGPAESSPNEEPVAPEANEDEIPEEREEL
jgi:hypothetical protein